jgi:hypothetical protein
MVLQRFNFVSLNNFCLQSVFNQCFILCQRDHHGAVGRPPLWRRRFFSNGNELREASGVMGHRAARRGAGRVVVRLLSGSMAPAHEREEDPAHEHGAACDEADRVLEPREVEDGVAGGGKCRGAQRVAGPISNAVQLVRAGEGGEGDGC